MPSGLKVNHILACEVLASDFYEGNVCLNVGQKQRLAYKRGVTSDEEH